MLLSIWDIGKESMNVILESRGESRIYMDILEADMRRLQWKRSFRVVLEIRLGKRLIKKECLRLESSLSQPILISSKRKLNTDFLYLICSVYSYNYQL